MEDIRRFVTERMKRDNVKDVKVVDTPGGVSDEYYSSGGKLMKMSQLKKDEGKKAKSNSSGGRWAINEPEEKNVFDEEELSKDQLTKNKRALLAKFRAEEDFFILGKAGWGKSSLIKKMAATFKMSVLTVYLDKAMASDLGGIPIPTRTSKGNPQQEYAMPGWAAVMLENPDKNYLLFFDEMNQAAPDVMNALMPIVLEHEICGVKFDNFFVGAAGNFDSENKAVNELSGPLASRFKPIINWETNTPGEWDDWFRHAHKVWDSVFGPEFIEMFHADADLFANPREIEHKIFKFLQKIIKSGKDNSMFDTDFWLNERLIQLVHEDDLTLTEKDRLAKLAENIYDFMMSNGESLKPKAETAKKGREMIPKNIQDILISGIKNGHFYYGDGDEKEKYALSEENVYDLFDPEIINAEQLSRFIKKLEAEGTTFYYKTNAEAKKDGLKLPE